MIKSKKKVLKKNRNLVGGKVLTKHTKINRNNNKQIPLNNTNSNNNLNFMNKPPKPIENYEQPEIESEVNLEKMMPAIDDKFKNIKNPFYMTYNLKQKPIKFNTEFVSPIQKIKQMLADNPRTVITVKEIEEFIKNPEKVSIPEYNDKIEENIGESDISTVEAISRICDFD